VDSVAEKCRLLSKNRILEVIFDVQNDADLKYLVEKTVETFGKIDILVNNVGYINYGLITDSDLMKNFDKIMNINLRSSVLLISLCAPYLEKSKGSIINISSLAALKPVSNGLIQRY